MLEKDNRLSYDHTDDLLHSLKYYLAKNYLTQKEKLMILDALSRAKNKKEANLYQKLGKEWI